MCCSGCRLGAMTYGHMASSAQCGDCYGAVAVVASPARRGDWVRRMRFWGQNTRGGGAFSTPIPFARAFAPKARSPDPATAPYLCWLRFGVKGNSGVMIKRSDATGLSVLMLMAIRANNRSWQCHQTVWRWRNETSYRCHILIKFNSEQRKLQKGNVFFSSKLSSSRSVRQGDWVR